MAEFNEFDDFSEIREFDPDELNEAFKEFSINLSKTSINVCSNCLIMMEYKQQDFMYACPQCGLSWNIQGAGNISESMADNEEHNINISARGGVFQIYANNNADMRIRKKLDLMNHRLKIPIHADILDKIFLHFKNNKALNRAKKDWAMLAHASFQVCAQNGVLISEPEIIRACEIDSDDYNSAKKTIRNLRISGNVETENIVDKLVAEVRIHINNLGIDEKFEPLLVLYVRVHQKLTTSSNLLKSRIAGAIWYLNIRAGLDIPEKIIAEKTNVSISTFKNDVAKEIEKVMNSPEIKMLVI